MTSFSDDLRRRLQDIDVVADVMSKKVQNMKKEMHTRKEVRIFVMSYLVNMDYFRWTI